MDRTSVNLPSVRSTLSLIYCYLDSRYISRRRSSKEEGEHIYGIHNRTRYTATEVTLVQSIHFIALIAITTLKALHNTTEGIQAKWCLWYTRESVTNFWPIWDSFRDNRHSGFHINEVFMFMFCTELECQSSSPSTFKETLWIYIEGHRIRSC